GTYTIKVPGPGQYLVKGELVAFAPFARPVSVDETNCHPRVDLEMTLASRAPAATAAADTARSKPASPADAHDGNGRGVPPPAAGAAVKAGAAARAADAARAAASGASAQAASAAAAAAIKSAAPYFKASTPRASTPVRLRSMASRRPSPITFSSASARRSAGRS